MIYTVFPKNYDEKYESSYMPQDFETLQEAKEYANALVRNQDFSDFAKDIDLNALDEKLSEKIYKSFPQGVVNGTAKTTILKTMDEAFIEHLSNIDMLKRDSGLGSFGESNPLLNFEERAHTMYNEMIDSILPEVVMELVEKTPKQFSFGKFNVPTNYSR